MQVTRQLEKLSKIASMPDNWNRNGAKAFSDEFIGTTRELLIQLEHVPEIFPTANGSLQFEYDKPDHSHLDIEIFEDVAEVYIVGKNGQETSFDIKPSAEEINKVVAEFEKTGESDSD